MNYVLLDESFIEFLRDSLYEHNRCHKSNMMLIIILAILSIFGIFQGETTLGTWALALSFLYLIENVILSNDYFELLNEIIPR